MIIPGECCGNVCAPCHIFMTDYLKRGSLTVISAMTFTECLCGTERHNQERGGVEVNGFLSVFGGKGGSDLFIYLWLLHATRATRCTRVWFNIKLCGVNLKRHAFQKCSFNFGIQVWNASNIHAPIAFLVLILNVCNLPPQADLQLLWVLSVGGPLWLGEREKGAGSRVWRWWCDRGRGRSRWRWWGQRDWGTHLAEKTLVPVKSTSEHLIAIRWYLWIMVQKYLLHNFWELSTGAGGQQC